MNKALPNDKMTANRFATWAMHRRKLAFILENLAAGRTVAVTNHVKSYRYGATHASAFSADRTGVYVKQGKSRLCINGNKVSAL